MKVTVQKRHRRVIAQAIAIAAVLALGMVFSGCGKPAEQPAAEVWHVGQPLPKEKVKIGVLHIANPTEESSGYDFAHHLGILAMALNVGLETDQIMFKNNIPDSDPAVSENAMRELIAWGANIIIAPSWGYMDACEKLSGEFPDVIFAHCSGYKFNDTNFTNYFGRIYQARYLSGIVAAMKTRTGKIGYVAAMGKDNNEVTSGINAFAIGVESVNPKVRILVKVTHSWFDPMGETNAAKELIASGCDVLAQHCDTPNPMVEAEKAGFWGIGYNNDMRKNAPDAVLTSVIWDWGPYYTQLVKSVIGGTFTTTPHFDGLAEGMVDISPLSQIAPEGAASRVAHERERIISGKFNVFDGVLETNDGQKIGQEGFTLSDSEITGKMNWYYRTVTEL